MSLRRIWLDERPASETFTIHDEAFHHAFRVSKFRVGEQFEIVCGGSDALRVQVKSIGKNQAELAVVGTRALPLPRQPYIGLAVCMPKWPTWDWIVEKAVELGASSIQPLISEHSALRSSSDFTPSKKDRTAKIIKSALEQSGWGGSPQLLEPADLKDWAETLNRTKGRVGLMCYEGEVPAPPQSVICQLPAGTQWIWALVGSEGGFSSDEADFLKSRNFNSLSFGGPILRTETACLTMLSVIRYELNLFL